MNEHTQNADSVPNRQGGVEGRGPAPTKAPPATNPPSWNDLKAENDLLKAAVARLGAEVERWKLMHIEAMNPGIDMEKVKAQRASQSGGCQS